jgi:hypothetical protein
MASFGISYITKILYSVITIILLIVIYSYLNSLENKGCKCAMTSNLNFIKGFTIFSIIYLIFTGLISDKAIYDNFGGSIVAINKFIDLIFVLVFIYYLYEVFKYTRYLVNEKCKCSTDIRREIIMIGSIIEIILIFILFILHIIIFTIFSVIFNVIKKVEDGASDLKGAIHDPIGSMSKIPSKLRSGVNEIKTNTSKLGKQIGKQIGKINNIPR